MILANPFQPATRQALKLRMALDGPSGSGKTFTALRAATALGKRIAVINTEPGSIRKYLKLAPDGIPFEFDIVEPANFAPSTYTDYILAAGRMGYDVLIVDSLSHAWEGEGGALDQVDKSRDANRFTAWKDVTPQHRRMIEAITRSPCHVIVTMRTKTEYVVEPNAQGKMAPKKIGTKPIQREGMEYEFDVVADISQDHVMTVSKSRCPEFDGIVKVKPDTATFATLASWLADGSEPPEGYYALNDDDLRAEAKAVSDSIPPEVKRQQAAAAMRAAMPAVAAPTVAAAATKPAPAEKPDPATTPIDDDHMDRIEAFVTDGTVTVDELRAMFSAKRYSVERLSQLTMLKGMQLLGDLMQLRIAKQDAAAAAQTKPAAEANPTIPQASEAPAEADDRPAAAEPFESCVSDATMDRIEAFIDGATITADTIRAMLVTDFKVERLSQLSASQGEVLIARLAGMVSGSAANPASRFQNATAAIDAIEADAALATGFGTAKQPQLAAIRELIGKSGWKADGPDGHEAYLASRRYAVDGREVQGVKLWRHVSEQDAERCLVFLRDVDSGLPF